jgi:hypothetical protein
MTTLRDICRSTVPGGGRGVLVEVACERKHVLRDASLVGFPGGLIPAGPESL